MFTEEDWFKVKSSYTERMVDFEEPLPIEDQEHLDSIKAKALRTD